MIAPFEQLWLRAASAALALLCLMLVAGTADAQEMLLNRSFETPVAPANGNNFYATMPNWTVTPGTAQALPVNIVKPWSGYTGNPTVPPTGGGIQYFDVNATSGIIRQSVTFAAAGMIDISGWFAVRDNQQALSGLTINVRNASNVVVATASTSFVATDAIGLWKEASAANIPVPAGTYTFEIVLPNEANCDLMSLVYKPPLTITKTHAVVSDPTNLTTNPKLIPGAISQYVINVANPATYTVTSNSVRIVDATPVNTDLVVTDIGAVGSGPASFTQGAPSSTLTYSYTSLGSTTDNIDFSNNGGSTWTYTPVANANGVDTAVTHVRVRPQGTMAASSSFSIRLRYRVR